MRQTTSDQPKTPYPNYFRFELHDKNFYFFFLIVCLFVYAVDHSVNEGEPVDEQDCEQANEGQFCDPEPEGQHFDQELLEVFEDDKYNPIL